MCPLLLCLTLVAHFRGLHLRVCNERKVGVISRSFYAESVEKRTDITVMLKLSGDLHQYHFISGRSEKLVTKMRKDHQLDDGLNDHDSM